MKESEGNCIGNSSTMQKYLPLFLSETIIIKFMMKLQGKSCINEIFISPLLLPYFQNREALSSLKAQKRDPWVQMAKGFKGSTLLDTA